MINDRFPAADFREVFLGCGHGPAESECQPALHFLCHERSRSRIHVHAQGVKIRCQTPGGLTLVEGSDGADFRIGKRSGDLLEIISFNTHVTVVHDKEIVFRVLS